MAARGGEAYPNGSGGRCMLVRADFEWNSVSTMPTISMFFGIIVRMYFAPTEHPPPHFHAYHGEYRATVDIRTCEVIQGSLPRKQTKLVLAWAELHQDELMADWKLVMNGEDPFKIRPLE